MTSSILARILWCERKLAGILQSLASILQRLSADEQQLAQISGRLGFGGSGGDLAAILTANLAAGTYGTPTTAAGTLLVPSGTGWTSTGGASITIYNPYATAITVTGSKFCWVQLVGSNYYLKVADC